MCASFALPGRWVGGISLLLRPALPLAAVLLRAQFHFFFPDQLAAFSTRPILISTSYGPFAAKRPGWAVWGATLTVLGLFARTHSAGIDYLAFQLVRVQNLDIATKAVADSYGAYNLFHAFSFGAFFGWTVLAIGAYLSGTLGLARSIALASMSALMLGTFKGTSPTSILATCGLCVASVPLGLQVLRDGPMPTARTALVNILAAAAVAVLSVVFGELG